MSSNSDKSKSDKTKLSLKMRKLFRWVLEDFRLRHLILIKLIFFLQSASMTVLYPFLNLHMKSLGLSVQEAAIINALIPLLFIFTPPLASFLTTKLNNFRLLLSSLTALGGLVSLLLLFVPAAKEDLALPQTLQWGLSCGESSNRARFQKLRLRGFLEDKCQLRDFVYDEDFDQRLLELSFEPDVCGYLCQVAQPVYSSWLEQMRVAEYKVVWPNRGGGFGISEIVDVVTLDTEETRRYYEPKWMDRNLFFPMNWTFHLSCNRIRPQDCIFAPIRRAPPADAIYKVLLQNLNNEENDDDNDEKSAKWGVAPHFLVSSITPPHTGRAVSRSISCGDKESTAQVIASITSTNNSNQEDSRFSSCSLQCLVDVPRPSACLNSIRGHVYNRGASFYTYMAIRTTLGVLTAASLMMFEGAVMATVTELGGDYGIQRFVGNFGAMIFAPLAGVVLDLKRDNKDDSSDFALLVIIYVLLKLSASLLLLLVRDLDFRPPSERLRLQHLLPVLRSALAVAFLVQMLFAGAFWGFGETFLFWFMDDIGSKRVTMGLTITVGMMASLPFLVFAGPITDTLGHTSVIVLGMMAYAVRFGAYALIVEPWHVLMVETLEGLTMALMMTSAVTAVAKIARNPDTLATIMGLMGALFFGVGKALGALVGGLLMHNFGARIAFKLFASNALCCAVAYTIFKIGYKCCRNEENAVNNDGNRDVWANQSNEGHRNGAFNSDERKSQGINNEDYNQTSSNVSNEVASTAIYAGPRSLTGGTRV